ncbi:MAG: response regulator transcription factor [Bacteroidetes bacterium]|nr:response regulator transcription factor [Bacteroidota bacterium]
MTNSKSKILIIVADDHHLIRDGIVSMLNNVDDFEIVGEAENGKEVVEKTKKLKPDVVIMDINMPEMNGIEATKIIKEECPDTRILVLTMYDNEEYIRNILEAGAEGYLLKNTKRNEFISAIYAVMEGEYFFSKRITNLIIKGYVNKSAHKPKETSEVNIPISKREKEVLALIVEELTNKEIADKLFISIRTVETHRRNIMEKLNVRTAYGLVKIAVESGLISVKNPSPE